MKTLLLISLLAGQALAQISDATLSHIIDSAAIPKVIYVDDNDGDLKDKLNEVIDSVNIFYPSAGSIFGTVFYSNTNIRATIDADANATGTKLAITHNGASDTIAKWGDDSVYTAWRIRAKDSVKIGNTTDALSTGLLSISSTASEPLNVLRYAGTTDISVRRANGSLGSPSQVLSAEIVGRLAARGYGATGFPSSATGSLEFRALENFTDAAMGTAVNLGATPIGSVTRATYFTLLSTGLGLFNSTTAPSHYLDVAPTVSGALASAAIRNLSNTASARARFYAEVAGTTASDPLTTWSIGSEGATAAASLGLDNSASDSAVFSYSTNLGTSNVWRANSSGFSMELATNFQSTLDVTGKAGSADSVYAEDGFRAGATAASNVVWHRSAANMWTTPDSVTIAGELNVTDSILGASGRLTGSLVAAGKVSSSDSVAASLGFRAGTTDASNVVWHRSAANMWNTPDSVTIAGRLAVTDSISTAGNEKFAYDEGTYTATISTGCTTTPTGTVSYVRVGKAVTQCLPVNFSCTSNSTSLEITGTPAGIYPPGGAAAIARVTLAVVDNGNILSGRIQTSAVSPTDGWRISIIPSGSVIYSLTGFTNSGTKGFDGGCWSYTLQ